MIIGLGYRAKSGKDTVGQMLVQGYGFHRVGFADALKDVCSVICFGAVFDHVRHSDFKEDFTPLGMTGGQLLQTVGVALREAVPGVWIDAAHLLPKLVTYGNVVVTDVRFLDEAKAVKDLGGILIEVRRHVPQDTHVSETEGSKIKWDHVIENDGSLVDLLHKVQALMASLGPSPLTHGAAPDSPQAPSAPAS